MRLLSFYEAFSKDRLLPDGCTVQESISETLYTKTRDQARPLFSDTLSDTESDTGEQDGKQCSADGKRLVRGVQKRSYLRTRW
ncbi:MAG: hypothetical protein D3919_12560 [Candidatus Electrothrix sp. AW5]|nr:hypothetical protein [Candidatus Electrothrix gigas]